MHASQAAQANPKCESPPLRHENLCETVKTQHCTPLAFTLIKHGHAWEKLRTTSYVHWFSFRTITVFRSVGVTATYGLTARAHATRCGGKLANGVDGVANTGSGARASISPASAPAAVPQLLLRVNKLFQPVLKFFCNNLAFGCLSIFILGRVGNRFVNNGVALQSVALVKQYRFCGEVETSITQILYHLEQW
ncbi:jg12847 [Pararge aegeria aegeria]|uniref:Jg12847 protein n=1 Tax=Pararge aegeria aegeria TaxID=348720 RepID=A0A8S4SDG7_9NEOP|nr:jg12847 [Pararge aegeria aegeria]